jgi:predicted nucleic acid-binding protein
MSVRFFLDTNVFVYSFDHGSGQKAAKAKKLIREALVTQKGVVSYQVVQEFFNVAFKRFAQPLKTSEAEQYLGTVFRPLLAVHSTMGIYSEALRIYGHRGLSWYDALIVGGAMQAQCDVLYTEDLQHGQSFGGLRIVNPFL